MPLAAELVESGLELLLNTNLAALSIASPSAKEANAQALARAVVFLNPQMQLRDALRVLAVNRVLSVPVLSSPTEGAGSSSREDATAEHQFEGFCDVASILHYLLELYSCRQNCSKTLLKT
jgi:hypothetical protein